MSRIRFLIAGLGLMGLLGCASTQSIEPVHVRPAQSSTDEWIASYRAKYGCIGVARVNNGPESLYDSSDQIELQANVAYKEACGIPGQIVYFRDLRFARKTLATGEVICIAFKRSQK